MAEVVRLGRDYGAREGQVKGFFHLAKGCEVAIWHGLNFPDYQEFDPQATSNPGLLLWLEPMIAISDGETSLSVLM